MSSSTRESLGLGRVQFKHVGASHASTAASAGAAADAAAGAAGACLYDEWDAGKLETIPSRIATTNATNRVCEGSPRVMGFFRLLLALQRRGVGFAGANAHRLFKPEDEDFAVSDLACLGCGRDGLDGLVGLVGRNRDLDLQLWQEAHGVLGASIDFRMALLTPIAL